MAAATERAIIAEQCPPATECVLPLVAAPKGWFGWRIVWGARRLIAWLATKLKRTDKRPTGEARTAEKERQKGIRRELRGLPATHDASGPAGPPAA